MGFEIGLLACLLASVSFGSMFVPVRKYNAGDGIFSQLMMSIAIMICSFLLNAYQDFPPFQPIAMIGGALWCLGNSMAIPIVNRLGMALGILLWNSVNCVTGWATATFGLFGTKARPPSNSILNYLGLIAVIVGGILFSQIKSDRIEKGKEEEEIVLSNSAATANLSKTEDDGLIEDGIIIVSMKEKKEKQYLDRIIGIVLSVCSGILYPLAFLPVTIMQDNADKFKNVSDNGLDYFFSFCFGIFITATIIFVIYTLVRKNEPFINNKVAVPALAAGVLWTLGQSSFFVANQNLSQSVSFPIITQLPGLVASLWSIFYFKEITLSKSIIKLAIASSFTLLGALLVGLSK
uniref:Transmembrane protein 144 n=1 Tax=Rhabditophanes sp. KR3021 TaxID=114890 RepID=A0AC35UBM1_9BILA